MSLLNPDMPLDEEVSFGASPLATASEGYDDSRTPKMGFIKQLLGKTRALL